MNIRNQFFIINGCIFFSSLLLSHAYASTSLDHVTAGGFGGNEKVGKFIYDGRKLPLHFSTLDILRDSTNKICYLQNDRVIVRIIDNRAGNPVVQFPCQEANPKFQMYWNNTLETVNGAYSPANDAMHAGNIVNSMYQDWYHVPVLKIANSIPAQPMPLVLRIHDWGGSLAYWDGKTANFGDGDADTYYPLVSLTLVAHEVSHGFTQQHSQLQYVAQSGALNESFSDMASKAAEFYSTGYNHDWKLADEIMKADRAYRYMDNPRRDCVDAEDKKHCSIDHVKDYSPDLNVHYTSGVFNKAFYLLATAPNWNTHKAFDVMVQANMAYWTQTTTFSEAACGVIEAAKDYGYEINTLAGVFAEIGIDTATC